ncbi:MAG: Gfo/Idh/MocA family oxidoreductase [Elusimicrobia bacterium]|nr:Gfo/Idh/MocA family oxidoreductase [Elusimicrobiota bacterium]
MRDKIGVAIVGYGYWGPNLLRNFSENRSCRVVLVCDRRPQRLSAAQARHPGLPMTVQFDEILQNPAVDAVALATPVSTHFLLGKRVLESGRHVLIEKPMAMSPAQAQTLLSLSLRKRKTLLPGHTFLYSPPVRRVSKFIRGGTLGRVYTMDFSRVNLGLFQPDVNVLWDLASHDVAIALSWLGRLPSSVRAQARTFVRKGIEEVGHIWMDFPNRVWVHIHSSWLAPVKLRRVSVVGSKKMLVYDDTESVEKVKIYNEGVLKNPKSFGEFQLTYRTGDILSPKIDASEPLSLEVADFLDCVRTGRKPRCSAEFGLRVVRVLDAAQRSMRKGGAPVKL